MSHSEAQAAGRKERVAMGIHWVKSIFTPDPRIEKRLVPAGVVAHCWDGSVPRPRDVLNISLSGAYLRTNERWYPDTVIKIVLRFDAGPSDSQAEPGPGAPITFCLLAQVVRSGPDGVGLRFLFRDPANARQRRYPECATDRRTLRRFLETIERQQGTSDRLRYRIET